MKRKQIQSVQEWLPFENLLENGIIKSLKIVGGCDGNTKGISKLVVGMKIEDVIEKLKGINCGNKGTSCPDQLSKALEKYLKEIA